MPMRWRASGLILILLGLAIGLGVFLPGVAPEGSWAQGAQQAGGRVWLAVIGAGLMLGGGLGLRHGVRVARRTPGTFLRRDEEARVLAAIAEFERRTSGEIRVHLARRADDDIIADARRTFERLGMTATQERNGVLFFIGVARRRFAVIGDAGIDAVVPDGFWNEVVEHVRERFGAGDYAGALVSGIRMAGEALAEHFPIAPDDTNELPDDISRD